MYIVLCMCIMPETFILTKVFSETNALNLTKNKRIKSEDEFLEISWKCCVFIIMSVKQ